MINYNQQQGNPMVQLQMTPEQYYQMQQYYQYCQQSTGLTPQQVYQIQQQQYNQEQQQRFSHLVQQAPLAPLTLSLNSNKDVTTPPLTLSLNTNNVITPKEESKELNLYIKPVNEIIIEFRHEIFKAMNMPDGSDDNLKCFIINVLFQEEVVTSRHINACIARYWLNNLSICADTSYQLYKWDEKETLFHKINEPTELEPLLSKTIDNINVLYQTIMMEKESLSKRDPYYTGDNGMLLHNILSSNYKKICRITDDITKSRCDSIYRNIISLLKTIDFKENIIEYLAEGGRPLFIPFKDNKVLYIGPNNDKYETMVVYVRKVNHAFTDKCRNMLSMNYNYIDFHQEYEAYIDFLEADDESYPYKYMNYDDYIRFNGNFNSDYPYYKSIFLQIIGDLANGNNFTKRQFYYFFGTIISGWAGKYFWHFYSPWQNAGKTALFELMSHLLGDYAGKHPLALITGKSDAIHQSALGSTMGERVTIIDETGDNDTFKYNEEVIKKFTGGPDEELTGRFSGASNGKTFKFKVTTQLVKASNNLDSIPVPRLVVVEFKSGFTENPDENLHNTSWYKSEIRESSNLLEGLKAEGAIKQADPRFMNHLKGNKLESLKFLTICIFHAVLRFSCSDDYNEVMKLSLSVKSHTPSTIQEFMNCETYGTEEDNAVELEARQNPYNNPVEANTPLSKWVTLALYYRTYCAWVLRNKPGVHPVNHSKFTIHLKLLGLLSEGDDRVKFLAKPPPFYANLKSLLEDNYELLQDSYNKIYFINEGMLRSIVHEQIINKVIESNKQREIDKKEPYHVPDAQNILSWITERKRDWIKGTGKSGNYKYYHIRRKDDQNKPVAIDLLSPKRN
jgi:hypothetical protein